MQDPDLSSLCYCHDLEPYDGFLPGHVYDGLVSEARQQAVESRPGSPPEGAQGEGAAEEPEGPGVEAAEVGVASGCVWHC
jgi:hypothetical protein